MTPNQGQRRAERLVIVAAMMVTLGCGGSGSSPASPTPPPSGPSIPAGTVVSVRSAETDGSVAGASISLTAQFETEVLTKTYMTDAGGGFTLDRAVLLSSTPLLEATAPGFLPRTTVLRPTEPVLSLWPASSPTGLDETFTAETIYSASRCPAVNSPQSPLRRPLSSAGTIRVGLSPELQNPAIEATHQEAIARLNAALADAPRYELASSGSGVSFIAILDPGHATCANGPEPTRAVTELTLENGSVVGGRLVYCSTDAARSASLVLHELGHTFGLYHSSSASDVMYCSVGRPLRFSAREVLAMKLIRQRRAGNRWPDNDRQTSAPLAFPGRTTEIISCGG
jgi:hypothetical protein